MYKKLFAAMLSLFLSLTVLPQYAYAEETAGEPDEDMTETEETGEEAVPEEIIENEESEEASFEEELPAEEEPETVIPEEETEEETVIVPEDEPEEVIEEELPEEQVTGETEEAVIEEEITEDEDIPAADEPEPEEAVVEEDEISPAEEEPAAEPEPEEAAAEETEETVTAEVTDAGTEGFDSAVNLTVGKKTTVSGSEEYSYYKVTPGTSGTYRFYGYMYDEVSFELYDPDKNRIAVSSYGQDDDLNDFAEIESALAGGKTYYLKVQTEYSFDLAVVKVETYTVVFNGNGGTISGQTSKSYSVEKRTLEAPEFNSIPSAKKDHANFLGWSASSTDSAPQFDEYETITVTSGVTYYAVWQDYYKVVLDANGGKVDGASSKTYYVDPEDPQIEEFPYAEKAHCNFLGWSTSKTASVPEYEEGDYMTVTTNGITYYAVWQDHYKVILDANGGTVGGASSKTYYVDPEDPELYDYPSAKKENSKFLGWSTSKTASKPKYEPGDYITVTTNGITYYAVWDDKYKVVFNANGGTISGNTTKTVTVLHSTGKVKGPSASRSYKKLIGWSTSKTAKTPAYKTNENIPVTKNATYYAVWTDYYVSFNANGGYFKTKNVTAKKTKHTSYLTVPKTVKNADKHKLFLGWSTSKTAKTAKYYPGEYIPVSSTKNVITLYAVWADCYVLTVYANGGKLSSGHKKDIWKIIKGKSIDTMSPDSGVVWHTGDGYPDITHPDEHKSFAGFGKTKTSKKPVILYTSTLYEKTLKSDLTLYALWDHNYIVKLDPNYAKGGRWEEDRTSKLAKKESVKAGDTCWPDTPVYRNSSKGFAGWSTKKNASVPMYYGITDKKLIPAKDMTLYAVWLPVRTITFDPSDGVWMLGENLTSKKERKYKILDGISYHENGAVDEWCTDHPYSGSDGFSFAGWSAAKDGTRLIDQINDHRFTKNMTLYAFYFEDPDYSSFNWKKTGSTWYLTDNEGRKYRSFYYQDKYYLDVNGAMVTGWYRNNGKWQYYNSSGILQKGWKKIGGKWYCFKNASWAGDVEMLTGWNRISKKWYYFNDSGVMQTGWKKIEGKWYYFESSGAMVTGKKVIKGKTYKFDSSGVCLNP